MIQFKIQILVILESYGRKDYIRILVGVFSLLKSYLGNDKAIIRLVDIKYLYRLVSRLDSENDVNDNKVIIIESKLTREQKFLNTKLKFNNNTFLKIIKGYYSREIVI